MIKKLYSILKKFQKPRIVLAGFLSLFSMLFLPIVGNLYFGYFVFSLLVFTVLIPISLVMSIHFMVFLKVISDKEKRNKMNNISVTNKQLSVRQLARQLHVSGYESFFILSLASKGERKIKQISKFNYQILD